LVACRRQGTSALCSATRWQNLRRRRPAYSGRLGTAQASRRLNNRKPFKSHRLNRRFW
jgi:hypothetical protein